MTFLLCEMFHSTARNLFQSLGGAALGESVAAAGKDDEIGAYGLGPRVEDCLEA